MVKGGQIALGTAAIGRPVYINIKQKDSDAEFSLKHLDKGALRFLKLLIGKEYGILIRLPTMAWRRIC